MNGTLPDINILIEAPARISSNFFREIFDLVCSGEQVPSAGFLDKGLKNSELIAILLLNETIISTASLKNPANSYKKSVFNLATVPNEVSHYRYELGYIATHKNYEGKGYCQQLLNKFFPVIKQHCIYATTRKPSMIHVLEKFQFRCLGLQFKKDLHLLVSHPIG